MKYLLICDSKDHYCGCEVWIHGSFDPETNAIELDDNDKNWDEACTHIGAGDYYIKDQEVDDE